MAAIIALGLMLVVGATLDDLLRSNGNAILYYAVMCPIGVAVLALAGVIAGATERD